MAMTEGYRNAIANHGASLIKHIGLVDDNGDELSGGSYARQAVTWTTASGGTVRPTADLTFDVAAGAVVAGWRGFSAATGGTNYGGQDFAGAEEFNNPGQFKLLASGTAIKHMEA
jgi:hypothetical protein